MMLLNDIMDIESVRIKPRRSEEIEGLGSGLIVRAEIGDPLWEVEIRTPLTTFQDGRRLRALLNRLDRPGAYFRVIDPIAQYAANDPAGTLLTSVTVAETSGGRIRFAGAPSGYQFRAGDAFQIENGGRHYYFEFAEDVAASALAYTSPTIPAGIPDDTAAVFIRPEIRCQFIPGSIDYGLIDSATWKMGGFTLKAVQKL